MRSGLSRSVLDCGSPLPLSDGTNGNVFSEMERCQPDRHTKKRQRTGALQKLSPPPVSSDLAKRPKETLFHNEPGLTSNDCCDQKLNRVPPFDLIKAPA